LFLGLALVTGLRLAVADLSPLAPDEAYYWVWSRALAAGYLDHPPMVAVWIRVGTMLAGDGALGVRLLAPLAAALGSVLLYRAGEDLFPGRRAGQTAALLLNATLLFGVGAVTMTPDTPLLFFWTVCLWAMARLVRTRRAGWWLVAGLAAGFALTSKYTAILLPAGLFAWCLLLPGQRRWLGSPMPWLAAAVAGLVFLPVLLWNAAHGWASFAKQGGRGFVWHPVRAIRFIGELIGGQVGLATPLVFLLCVAAIVVCARRAWREDRAAEGLVAAFTIPALFLFLQHALGDRVQANWPAVIYPGAALGVAGLGGGWSRLITPAAILGGLITTIVYTQAVFHPIALGARLDPTIRLRGWPAFNQQIGALVVANGAAYIASDNYGIASMLARTSIPVPVIGVEPRWRLFDLPNSGKYGRGLLVRPADRGDNALDGQELVLVGKITRGSDDYRIFAVDGSLPGVVLPRL
jgi:4-amino-4-deoxy-L-arabinose transferase-like glycosyltransferase